MFFISKKRKLLESEKLQSYLIRLDKKGRLVLPLEIRDAIDIKPGQKILLCVSAANDAKVFVEIAKAPERAETYACSRNAGYIKKANRKMEV